MALQGVWGAAKQQQTSKQPPTFRSSNKTENVKLTMDGVGHGAPGQHRRRRAGQTKRTRKHPATITVSPAAPAAPRTGPLGPLAAVHRHAWLPPSAPCHRRCTGATRATVHPAHPRPLTPHRRPRQPRRPPARPLPPPPPPGPCLLARRSVPQPRAGLGIGLCTQLRQQKGGGGPAIDSVVLPLFCVFHVLFFLLSVLFFSSSFFLFFLLSLHSSFSILFSVLLFFHS